MNSNDNSSRDATRALRRRRWVLLFFAAWTVFACAVVWWLTHRSEESVNPNWVISGDTIQTTPERISNWFKLFDLNFRGIYPFILLTPYAAWFAMRFHLEQGRCRVSLPAHLAACVLFLIASNFLAEIFGPQSHVFVAIRSEARISPDGKEEIVTSASTNLLTNFLAAPWMPPPAIFGGGMTQTVETNRLAGRVRGAMAWGGGPGDAEPNGIFFRRRWSSQILWDILNLFGYAAVVGLVHAVHFYDRSRERERRASALEAQLATARLSALQAQLHPHFLFNALNAISTLLRRDTCAAQDALASFSELLRLALSHSSQSEVSLREDVEFLRRYVEIQQTRLGDRLRFEEEIDPSALDCVVPALLLQPLVENAVRHGIEPSPDPGMVRVAVHKEDGKLLVRVEDNGAGLSSKEPENSNGTGIGLLNLRSRLETLYGHRQRVEVGIRDGGGVSVRIEIPLREARSGEATTAA
ncbi:MAG TPA: sensor histidine kinase [Verrucomicrobiae bacterium]